MRMPERRPPWTWPYIKRSRVGTVLHEMTTLAQKEYQVSFQVCHHKKEGPSYLAVTGMRLCSTERFCV